MKTKKPIIMSAPMIVALNARRKRQTRRTTGLETLAVRDVEPAGYGTDKRGRFCARFVEHRPQGSVPLEIPSPYGGPGCELWVREGVRRTGHISGFHQEVVNGVVTVDRSVSRDFAEYIADGAPAPCDSWGWKNKALPAIHMPRGMCRHELRLETVTVERLQAITEEDAIAEGLEPFGTQWSWPGSTLTYPTARAAYGAGWIWLHGPESWEQNPLVWKLAFEPVVSR